MLILKQSTAVDVIIGPFVDSTNGDSEETGLTIANTDVLLSKNGQTMAAKNDVTSCAHDAKGMYNCELDATDTNTVGNIVIFVHVSGALAVRHELQIVEEAVYDDLFGGSAAGYAGIAALATVDTAVDGIQTDLSNGTDGLGAIKSDTAAILTDTSDIQPNYATATALATVDTVVDSILIDTAEIGAAGAGLTDLATAANLATVDTVVDAILVDTGTTIPAQITGLNDVAATDIVSAGAITTLAGAVVNVDLVDTTTTNTDMRGTDGANTVTPDAAGTAPTVAEILTTQMTESYAGDGVAPTLAQCLFLIQQSIGDFAIAGTVITTKKLDGSTTAATYTLDDGTNPTSRTRAS